MTRLSKWYSSKGVLVYAQLHTVQYVPKTMHIMHVYQMWNYRTIELSIHLLYCMVHIWYPFLPAKMGLTAINVFRTDNFFQKPPTPFSSLTKTQTLDHVPTHQCHPWPLVTAAGKSLCHSLTALFSLCCSSFFRTPYLSVFLSVSFPSSFLSYPSFSLLFSPALSLSLSMSFSLSALMSFPQSFSFSQSLSLPSLSLSLLAQTPSLSVFITLLLFVVLLWLI